MVQNHVLLPCFGVVICLIYKVQIQGGCSLSLVSLSFLPFVCLCAEDVHLLNFCEAMLICHCFLPFLRTDIGHTKCIFLPRFYTKIEI